MRSSMVEMQALYEQQGYLSGMSVLSTAELQEARDAFAKLERKFGEEYTSYRLHNVHLEYNWVMALTKHPKLLELVKAILGPDVILLDSRFICKYPVLSHSSATKQEGNGVIPYAKWSDASEVDSKTDTNQQDKTGLPFVAWHQDMRYWGLAGGPVLSVWLSLDDSSEDNGALQVIPGSHLSGLLTHQTAQCAGNMLSVNQEIPEELVQTENSVLCPLQAGQMSVHDGLLVHASDPNMSGWRRCGFVIRYIPTTAYPIQDPERPRHFHATERYLCFSLISIYIFLYVNPGLTDTLGLYSHLHTYFGLACYFKPVSACIGRLPQSWSKPYQCALLLFSLSLDAQLLKVRACMCEAAIS